MNILQINSSARGENFFQITAAAAERTIPYARARLSIHVNHSATLATFAFGPKKESSRWVFNDMAIDVDAVLLVIRGR